MPLHFRDELRDARAVALEDAEAFEQIVFVLEHIGVFLTRRVKDLGTYRLDITTEALKSPLAEEIPTQLLDWHTPFATLYELVQQGRNDALHQGAFARHLTNHAVELALVLEDALMVNAVAARDFMVKDPVCALLWQPINIIDNKTPSLIEVFPHPALLVLCDCDYRIPYKVQKVRKYWPNDRADTRRSKVLQQMCTILDALKCVICDIPLDLNKVAENATFAELKAIEDMIDALVCAWVGIKYLCGEADPYGDDSAAIWVPSGTSPTVRIARVVST